MAQNYIRDFGGASRDWLSKSQISITRPSVYAVTGDGRDTYIGKDNGGLYNKYMPAPAATIGTFDSPHISYGAARPRIETKHSNYHSVGCGRDSYISKSNGGFYPEKTAAEFSKTFVNNLRYYDAPMAPRDIVRPRASSAARKRSKVGAESEYSQVGSMYKSQVGFYNDKSIPEKIKQVAQYQGGRSVFLCSPKKPIQKFAGMQSRQVKLRPNNFSDWLLQQKKQI